MTANRLLVSLMETPPSQRKQWCDYWRGFWDATIQIHKGPRLAMVTDDREYANGHATGDGVYKQHQHEKRKDT